MFNGVDTLYKNTVIANQNREIKKTLDKDAFMKLLITQMQNQDPTQPMDNKEFIAQMSQLSSTEQIMNMSKSFQSMIDSQMNLFKLQSASLVGKNVKIESDIVNVTNGTAETFTFSNTNKAPITFEVYDQNGKKVYSEDLGIQDSGVHSVVWDAKNESGTAVKDGTYTYKVYQTVDGKKEQVNGIQSGKVEAVQFAGNDFYVIVGGKKYPISSIKEVTGNA